MSNRRKDFSKYVGLASGQADQEQVYKDLYRRGRDSNNRMFPQVKKINPGKIKQLKLPGFKTGGSVDDPLKGIAKMITNIQAGKTGIKTVDKQKKKDAILTKNLKRMAKTSKVKAKAKTSKVKAKPQTLDITPKAGSALSIQKETITMAKDGGLMEAIEKVKAKEMQGGGKVKKYIGGGPVKSEKGKSICRGMGAARAGGKFKIR